MRIRIECGGITPTERFAFGERWEGDRCVLCAEELVRQEIECRETLSPCRHHEGEPGSNRFSIADTVGNEGAYKAPHQMLYQMNVGWPVVNKGKGLIASLPGCGPSILFGDDGSDPTLCWSRPSATGRWTSYGRRGWRSPRTRGCHEDVE